MFTTAAEAKTYALSGEIGSPKLTLESKKTGKWYTYSVSRARDRATGEPKDFWFVGLLSGPDNTADYQYLGMLDGSGFRLTKASKLTADSAPVRGFNYFWKHITQDQLPTDMTVRHEGSCGRCGRTLTTPRSLQLGIGPECAAKMGLVCD
jgi:hypothetical protein